MTASACPDVTSQSLAHMAAKVEVFEEEGVRRCEVVTVADLCRFGLFANDHFKVHDFASLCFLHLNSPCTWGHMLGHLFKSLLLTHLKLEWFAEEVK